MSAVRASMARLIRQARRMIGDLGAGTARVFDDLDIQEALDNYRTYVRYAPLAEQPTYPAGGGSVTYTEFFSPLHAEWESDAAIVDADHNPLTTQTADYQTGRFTFAASQTAQPLMISGSVFDINGAAADLLEQWVAQTAGNVDTTDADTERKRSQAQAQRAALAKRYRARQKPVSTKVTRSDVRPR